MRDELFNIVYTKEEKIRIIRQQAISVAAVLKYENNVTISKQAKEDISQIIHGGMLNKSMDMIGVS